MVCLDLFIAGSQTTSTTLEFAFLMMILHPDVQAKVQKQLDEMFDPNTSIQYSDKKSEAVNILLKLFFLYQVFVEYRMLKLF